MANGNDRSTIRTIFEILLTALIIWLFATVNGNTNKLTSIEVESEMSRINVQLQLDNIKDDTEEIKDIVKSLQDKK